MSLSWRKAPSQNVLALWNRNRLRVWLRLLRWLIQFANVVILVRILIHWGVNRRVMPRSCPRHMGLTEADLVQLPPDVVGGHSAEGARNALEAIDALRAMYSGTISYEFDQVKSADERSWLRDAVGLNLYHTVPTPKEVRTLLKRLTQVEVFERYLQQILPGQKRFSIEGLDILVPMLDEIIAGAFESETREIIIGMAHRGRLNVLTHVLGKSYGAILAEFAHARHEEGIPLTDTFGFGWTGDVKYHLGAENICKRMRRG